MGKLTIDWDKLHRKFLLSNCKTLKDFADREGLKYNSNFRRKAHGWLEEKGNKEAQIVAQTVAKSVDKISTAESQINEQHYAAWQAMLTNVKAILENGFYTNEAPLVDPLTGGLRTDTFGNIVYKSYKIYLNPKSYENLAKAMRLLQEGQRLAKGLDVDDSIGDFQGVIFPVGEPPIINSDTAIEEWNKQMQERLDKNAEQQNSTNQVDTTA